MPSVEQIVFPFVLASCAAAALGLVYGIRVLAAYLRPKIHNQFVGYMLSVVETLASKVVADVYQTYVSPLKAAGNFGEDAQRQAKQQALNKLKSYLGADGLAKVAEILGSGADTEQFLKSFLEDAVKNSKGVVVGAVPQPAPSMPTPTVVLPPSNPN